jgi:hypothetical protein
MNFFQGASINKFRNKKVTIDGILFDSKKESGVYLDLKSMKERGEIKDFERQKTFELLPNQCETEKCLNKKGQEIEKKKVIERAITYTADFVVTYPDGEIIVVDCKGSRGLDQKYPIKRKMMLFFHHIKIKEV